MNKIFLISFFVFFLNLCAYCQNQDYTSRLNFIIHLSDIAAFEEAQKELTSFSSEKLSYPQLDTINFIKGTIELYLKKDSLADIHLTSVSDSSKLYYPSRFFNALNFAEKEKFEIAQSKFCEIEESTSSEINQLREFEIAACLVLNKKFNSFDSISRTFDSKIQILKNEQDNLIKYAKKSKDLRRKSAFTAGFLSAVLPGLGKVYAGNNAQGLSSFLSVALFAGMTTENWLRNGWNHPQTLIFGSLFSIFYIGNVWGSALSVQLVKTEKELENRNNILVGMRVPIQKFFR